MGVLRGPFQGVTNIIRFNWHFFALALFASIGLISVSLFVNKPFENLIYVLLTLILTGVTVPLVVSLYIYDFSGLYKLRWLDELSIANKDLIVNIHSGFDEISAFLQSKYPESTLEVFDFYEPTQHTELSIKRARAAYPPFPGTVAIYTSSLPLATQQADYLFVIFAAHEIRNENERIAFFKELGRVLNSEGKIIVVEHMRDTLNFLAYNIGALHFFSKAAWNRTFIDAGLSVTFEGKLTPFIRKFVLQKNGNAF